MGVKELKELRQQLLQPSVGSCRRYSALAVPSKGNLLFLPLRGFFEWYGEGAVPPTDTFAVGFFTLHSSFFTLMA